MSRRLRKVGMMLSILALLGIFSASAWRYASRRTAVILMQAKDSFESETNRTVPLGSDKVRVQQFLESKRMHFVDTVPGPQEDGRIDGETVSTIEATSTDELETPLGVCWNSARFRFDSRGRLLGYADKPVCKGIL